MKYKVIYRYRDGSSNAGLAEASFYVKAHAIASAEAWREIGTSYAAFVWDGSTWTTYAPIP